MKTLILLLFIPLFAQAQSLKPLVVDSFYLFTEPQIKRIITISENGFVAFDSLIREKAITLEQDKTISSQEFLLKEFKAGTENLSQQVQIYQKEAKSMKKQLFWSKVKGTIMGGLNVLLILAILLVTV